MADALRLPPEPQSAGAARAWVREQLTRMGRAELVESATAGVSELVSNAVLHARTSLTVALDDSGGEVLIEVSDASNARVRVEVPADPVPDAVPTVGNGLRIIGVMARRWGVRQRGKGAAGKTVWFVPVAVKETAVEKPGRGPAPAPPPGEQDDSETLPVVITDAPVRLLWQTRFRVRDLRREMTLLALQRTEPVGVPHRLMRVAEEVDRLGVAVLIADESLEAAVHHADEFLTLRYQVPHSAGASCALLADRLDEADAYCRDAQLLTLAATPRERALRRWFLHEFERQVRGLPPRPWRAAPDHA